MSRVFWDTNLFIYLIEGSGERAEGVARLRQRMMARGDQLYTSTLTLGEVLVKPAESKNETLRQQYEQAIAAGAVLIPFDQPAARLYSSIRRDRTIRPPDAIQLACAAQARVDLFITNDDRLSDKVVPGINFVASLEKTFL
ncbi:MAG TPA: type II toxin-antitoxin system VapC family toxin [Methylomirabilota bacterium]|nr:type II toxin-antitoxin system VapC family toxin [Methylomirabilota bacterium]